MKTQKWLHMIAFVLVIVGGVNWGIFGLFNHDLIEDIFGNWPTFAEIIYTLVGIAAVYLAATHMNDCKVCSAKK
jgi:uncharacterized membrane protein YuzA (DUF378 family)